ncbi:MAG: PQQ-binding-like beta-propeller repeat protein [Myxococcota bacterium]|nr:PQQ-binding-like beta-propeller repeat protein [Myxococcota bacterium]
MILTGCWNTGGPGGGDLTQDTQESASLDTGDGQDTGSSDCTEEDWVLWFLDEDGDGYGSTVAPTISDCEAPSGYVAVDGDCEDTLPEIHPGVDEICDGLDNDCDGQVDNDPLDGEVYWQDSDGDGYGNADVSARRCGPSVGWVQNTLDPDDSDSGMPGRLPGDWPTLGGSTAHTGYYPGTVDGVLPELSWTLALSSRQQAVVVQDGVVYRASGGSYLDADVVAQRASDGLEIWRHTLPEDAYSLSPPTVHDGRVYLQRCNHSSDSQLWALDTLDGQALWSAPYRAQWETYLAPVVAEGRAWFGSGSYGGISGVQILDGTELFWQSLPQYDAWAPAYADGELYSFVEGVLISHEPDTGETLWSLDLGWDWFTYTLNTAPVVGDERIYVVGNYYVAAVDRDTGGELWSVAGGDTFDDPVFGVAALGDGVLFVLRGGDVEAYDSESGALLGTMEMGDWSVYGSVVGRGAGYLIVTDDTLISAYEDTTYFFDLESFELLGTLPHGGALALSDSRLFITDYDGLLAVYQWPLE